MSTRAAVAALVFAALSGCVALGRYRRDGGAVGLLAVRRVEWNPTRVAVGRVSQVAESGDDLAVFGDAAATVLRAGALVTVAGNDPPGAAWRDAATLPACDGNGTWIVGVDGHGAVRRLYAERRFEPVSQRFGLAGVAVRAVRPLGAARAAFLLDGELAISDGARVTRYPVGAVAAIAGGGARVAILDGGAQGVRVIDPVKNETRRFLLPGAVAVALDGAGRLAVATGGALYVEDGAGALALRYLSDDHALHGLAVAGARLWFADGAELGVLERERVRVTRGARIDRAASLAGSPSGDLWVLAGGALTRFAVDDETHSPRARWDLGVAPIYARVCSACHQPGGAAGIDLSTVEAWERHRPSLRERVITRRSMPPAGHPISDEDRDTVRGWLDGN